MDVITCPTCGLPAEVLQRFVLESTSGPMEHAAIRCVERHVYRLPLAMLEPVAQVKAARSTTARR